MTDTEQGAALLRGILDHPADDLPRLVYADWLDENGQAERAEFVRVQVELAKLPDVREASAPRHLPPGAIFAPLESVPLTRREVEAVGCLIKRRRELQARERAFLTPAVTKEDLLAETFPGEAAYRAQCRAISRYREWVGPAIRIVPTSALFHDHITFRRGFVEKIRCTLDAWLEHGPAIVRAHPVARIGLSDKEPWAGRDAPGRPVRVWGWWGNRGDYTQHRWDLPIGVLVLLAADQRRLTGESVGFDAHDRTGGVFFGSPEDCADATSDALLALAGADADQIPGGGSSGW